MADRNPNPTTTASGQRLVAAGPVALIAFAALAVLAAVVALAIGWLRGDFLVAAVGAGVAAIAMLLLYRQTRERQATDRALQNVEARVSGIVESAMDPIIAVDENQRIVLFNAAAEEIFRWPRSAVLGQSLDMLLPERFRPQHRDHIERFGRTGVTSRRMGGQTVLMALRANGEEFPIEASISHHSEDRRKFFTVILRDVTERIRAEEALRRSRQELQELAAEAQMAREQEKSRVARELHDELAQALTGLKMDVAWIAERFPDTDDAVGKKLQRVEILLDQAVAATRRIAADLRPLILDDLGLVPAVEWLVQNFIQKTGVPCELAVDDPELELENIHATAVFRILQESLTNVAKHAQASRVRVRIEHADGNIVFSVRDNGVGFSPQSPRLPHSLGLAGVRERSQLLGGELCIVSAPGEGATIEVRLPVPS